MKATHTTIPVERFPILLAQLVVVTGLLLYASFVFKDVAVDTVSRDQAHPVVPAIVQTETRAKEGVAAVEAAMGAPGGNLPKDVASVESAEPAAQAGGRLGEPSIPVVHHETEALPLNSSGENLPEMAANSVTIPQIPQQATIPLIPAEDTAGIYKKEELQPNATDRTYIPLETKSVYTEVIKDLESMEPDELRRAITLSHVINFVSIYGNERMPEDYKRYEDIGALETFANSLEEELNTDPFYHVNREYDPDDFYYRKQAWEALGATLRRKYEIARMADRAIMKAQDSVTVSYQTSAGVSIRARPAMVGENGDALGMRLRMERLWGIERIDLTAGINEFGAGIVKRLPALGEDSRFRLEYEYDGNPGSDGHSQEHISRASLEVPVW